VEKVNAWVEALESGSIGRSHIYLGKGQSEAAELFFRPAPETHGIDLALQLTFQRRTVSRVVVGRALDARERKTMKGVDNSQRPEKRH
jgi:hypothetical protein